jgi:hypothetical protein
MLGFPIMPAALPACLRVKGTPTHLHVRLDIWMVSIHLEESDEDYQYFFDSREKAEFAAEWAAQSRWDVLQGRPGATDFRLSKEASVDDSPFTKYEIAWWGKKTPDVVHDVRLGFTAWKDRIYVRHTPHDFCIL